MELLVGAAIGFTLGLPIGFRLHRGQLARARERLSYAARELDRRKTGALKTDLQFHRIDGRPR